MEAPLENMAGFQSQPTINYTESVDSSPKSSTPPQQLDWEQPLPRVPGAKLRLMCSYAGHIIPRPHDKNLCYVGGETRIIVVDRNSSLSDLTTRLSHTLLEGRKFTLKYQLPNEELDSLISVTTDDDLDNMIEEYDRIMSANNSFSKPSSRLRVFLFMAKPETAQTMGALLDDAQSQAWFVEALNGAEVLARGLSDSAAVGDLLRLDSGDHGMTMQVSPPGFSQTVVQSKVAPQDVHSIQSIMSDSPMVESTSSFDSSTSSPSMAHLPPIRVRVDEISDGNINNTKLREDMKQGGVALEDQFSSQLRVAPPPIAILARPSFAAVATVNNNNDGNDDEVPGLSDHGAARKPPLPLPVQHRVTGGFNNLPSPNDSKHAAGFNMQSPESLSSDSSIASGISHTKTLNHDQAQVASLNENKPQNTTQPITEHKPDNRAPSPPNQSIHLQPSQDPTKYMYSQRQQEQHQHQFIQENTRYIPTHSQISPSYRPVYATQHDHQQYPMYYLPISQTQPYNVAQPGTMAHPGRPVYATRAPVAPTNNQFQQQYIGYNQTVQPNYGHFDYGQNQVYYTGQVAAAPNTVPMATSQYQSITPAQAAMIAEASMQQLPKIEQPPT